MNGSKYWPAWTLAIVALVTACGEPEIVMDPGFTQSDTGPTYYPCSDTVLCPGGLTCVNGICDVLPPDTSPPPDTLTPPDVPTQDTGTPTDTTGPKFDTKPPSQDTGPPVGEDTGQPPVNECTYPGTKSECQNQEYCRVDEVTGAMLCIGATSTNPHLGPCSTHEHCDLLYGCHFKLCLTYCELQFGDAGCIPTYSCQNLGNAVWGACVPPP